MLEDFFSIFKDPANRVLVDWMLKVTTAIGAALGSVWLFFRGKAKAKKAAQSQPLPQSNSIRFFWKWKTYNSTWIFVLFAGFAAFALLQVKDTKVSTSQISACAPDLRLPDDPREVSTLLNNHGMTHTIQGARDAALACYEEAIAYDALNWRANWNLFKLHYTWDKGNRGTLYEIADRMIDRQISEMASFTPPTDQIGLPCEDRSADDRGQFSPLPWYVKMTLNYQDGKTEKAVQAVADMLKVYPDGSCIKEDIVSDGYSKMARVYCLSAQPEKAEEFLTYALQVSPQPRRFTVDLQETLRDASLYTGPIDGSFGANTRAALTKWVRLNCPGMQITLDLN